VPRSPLGSLIDSDLRSARESAGFRSFRRTFELRRGLATHLAMQRTLGQEIRWDPTGPPRKGKSILDQMEEGAPLPEVCRSCYKSLGV